jgi:hypothetical protein
LAFVTPLSDGPAQEPESGVPAAPAEQPSLSLVEEEPRRYPSTVGGFCYLVILALTVLGLVVVALGHWRGGVHVIAAALAVAGAARGVLPRRDACMLEVRSRWFDAGLLVGAAVAVWVLASTIPNAA